MRPDKAPTRILSGGLEYIVKPGEAPEPLPSGGLAYTVTPEGVDGEQALITWRMWRGSPELLAHIIRVAERVTDAVETNIDLAVRMDHERFASPKDFLEDVTLDALRNFRAITIRVRGPRTSAAICFEWLKGDNDAQVVATATGGEAFSRQAIAALTAIHHAIERGGTYRRRTQRLFQWLVQGLFLAAFFLISLAVVILLTYTPIPSWLATSPIPLLGTDDGLATVAAGIAGALSVAAAIWFGRRAYPSLEVAEGGETRLWRAGRRLGGPLLASAITVGIKLLSGS